MCPPQKKKINKGVKWKEKEEKKWRPKDGERTGASDGEGDEVCDGGDGDGHARLLHSGANPPLQALLRLLQKPVFIKLFQKPHTSFLLLKSTCTKNLK